MNRTLLTSAAILMTVSSAAFAQTNPTPARGPDATAPMKTPADGPQADGTNLQQQLTTNLQQSGFTDVKIMPGSFIVQAKDKTGNQVNMFISPDSMSEVTAVDANGKTGRSAAAGAFTSVSAKDDMSSKVVGLDVYNKANQDIGTIKDVAYDADGVRAYIVGVGGFLGMGDHYVAVRPSAMTLSYNANEKQWHAAMDANADQLKAAPEYKYPSNS
jgi:hypothetical protein